MRVCALACFLSMSVLGDRGIKQGDACSRIFGAAALLGYRRFWAFWLQLEVATFRNWFSSNQK